MREDGDEGVMYEKLFGSKNGVGSGTGVCHAINTMSKCSNALNNVCVRLMLCRQKQGHGRQVWG